MLFSLREPLVSQSVAKTQQFTPKTFTSEQFRAVMQGDEESRITALQQLLGYPIKQHDPGGSRFWYLRPGIDELEAEETCPIAVGFYPELNNATDQEIKQLLSAKERQEIYGHYIKQAGIPENQPVMYLLLPEENQQGRVALVLPTEGGLRQKHIQTFHWRERELLGRLERLRQGTLRIADRLTALIPQIDWVFYPGVKTAQKLAQLMAEITRQIEQAIPSVYAAEEAGGYLHKLFESFRKELLPTLKLQGDNEKDYSFADIYAQTVAYGLFTARVFGFLKFKRERKNPNDLEPDFYRNNAWKFLPETNPFLRKLFKDISEQPAKQLGEDLVSAVSELLSVLRAAEMEAVLSDFEHKIGQEDIIIRFYEDFLQAYKPQMREKRGVYYTPQPVVSYIVRSVDHILKKDFGLEDGLADATKIQAKSSNSKKTAEKHKVLITDPAVGTGTFLHEVINHIYKSFKSKPEQWSDYIAQDLLPRLYGFELLMAPYAIAHMKLSLQLAELGYQFDTDERLRVYLTNTLQEAFQIPVAEDYFSNLFLDEANAANQIKEIAPVMVILGNPPYSGHSANNGDWIRNLLKGKNTLTEQQTSNYFEVNGKPLGEKNPKWLNDDYVKFIRFGQWRIEKTGYGVLAFVTNHSYLDNPTFRGMRQSLLETFDDIYVLNLHGNSLKKESCPDGSKDENVFDIQQGVSINIFVKHPNGKKEKATIHHADLWGDRACKCNWLGENDLTTTQWTTLQPQSEFYLFVPQDNDLRAEYEKGWKVTDIFPVNNVGIVTARDKLTIHWSQEEAWNTVRDFAKLQPEQARTKYSLGKDTRDWKVELAQKDIKNHPFSQTKEFGPFRALLTPILYRPFNIHHTYYTGKSKGFHCMPRGEVMSHMLAGKNLAITIGRAGQVIDQGEWNIIFCSQYITEFNLYRRGGNNLFPLYLYTDINKTERTLLNKQRSPNLSQVFLAKLENDLGYLPTPEAIFYYIYSILHCPTYRTRYAEFLKFDFPRVPLTSNDELFRQLADDGEQLVQLHLMTSPKLDNLITEFVEGTGDRTVAPGHPKYKDGAVHINRSGDRFTGVPEEVWNFYVGGYQICHKWLKDLKGRTLSSEDILHYQKVVVALKETIELMAKIDEAIPGFPIQ